MFLNPSYIEMLQSQLISDAWAFAPELLLCGSIVLLLVLRLFNRFNRSHLSWASLLLTLGALGMSIMASSNDLLMVYIGVEMASLPSYALAGFLKGRRQSSEASLKYVVYGGGASGVMLYGISLLAGKFGTAHLPGLAIGYIAALQPGAGLGVDAVLVLGT